MKTKLLSFVLTVSMIATLGFNVKAANYEPQGKQTADKRSEALQRLSSLSNGNLKFSSEESNGQIFLSGRLSSANEVSVESVLNYLEQNKDIFGLENAKDNFQMVNKDKDELGYTHFKMQQTIKGLPIEGKTISVHYNNEGIVTALNGNVENKAKEITKLSNGNILEKDAIDIALRELSFKKIKQDPTVKKIVIVEDDKAYETYKVNVNYKEPTLGEWNVYVEAYSGNVLKKEDRMRYDGAVTGTGTAVVGGTKPLNLYQSGTSYQMKDITKPMNGQIVTYTANNTTTEQLQLISNTANVFNTESFKAGVSAHYFAGVVYDFYKNLFNRNSIDNNGMSIISTVHYDNAWNNAGWGSGQMVYGDGDGSTFTYLSGDLDVVAHEMTHGVDEKTADLIYQGQSGALNESMSDVLGVLIETYDKYNVRNGGTWSFNVSDWVVGDEIYTPNTPGDALRSLANPTLYSQPDNMSSYVNTTSDNGGVHTNSGIPNKAGFLIAQSVGCEKTARIYYRALSTYMNSSTNFAGARTALIQAATDLYGATSAEVTAINNAYDAIGVGGSTPPTPSTDTYEPNNTTAQAYAINPGTTYDSYIYSATDVDYYKLTTTQAGTITVNLSNLPNDYDLYLLNSSGTQLGKSENGSTIAEKITYTGAAGTYYIKVMGYSSVYSTTVAYALKADFTGTPTPTDPYEPNDTIAQAYQISSGTTYNSYIYTATDVDYYKFTVASSKSISISLSNLPGDYDLYLVNSSGTVLASSEKAGTTSEAITYTASAGTYYVKVIGYSGAKSTTVKYALKVTY